MHGVRLDSPVIAVPNATLAQLALENFYRTEASYDGGVLEISVNGGAFVDSLAAGGSFVQFGYDGPLSTSFGNPLGGRQAWNGDSSICRLTQVDLPASVLGNNMVLRWRFGSDSSVSSLGWLIDDVVVTTTAVPQPATLALFGLGFVGLAAARRRRTVA